MLHVLTELIKFVVVDGCKHVSFNIVLMRQTVALRSRTTVVPYGS